MAFFNGVAGCGGVVLNRITKRGSGLDFIGHC